MREIFVVGLGGFLGSSLRYSISGLIQKYFPSGAFPAGTLGVNVIGCFVLGLLGGWSENLDAFGPASRLFLFIGVIGGFTTFSSFSYETMSLFRDGQFVTGTANIGLQIFLGLLAVGIGYGVSALK